MWRKMNYKKNFEKYKIRESDFSDKIRELGKITPSTKEEDINEHWDIKLETKYDVKAIRKVNRYDNETNENIHWVELKNVNGKHGWLYGEADKFAFELDDYWLIVDKHVLQDFISKKCRDKEKTKTPQLYKLYTRDKRRDIITLVKTIDLIYISEGMIIK